MATTDVLEKDNYFMMLAIDQAKNASALDEVPVGAVLVCDDQVISEAFNKREALQLAGAHAEVLAIGKANQIKKSWRLEECTLYVTLEPCSMCAGAILNSRIKRLVFGARDPKAGAVESLYSLLSDSRLNHQVEFVGGVEEEKCSVLLKEFFTQLRQKSR